MRKKNFPKEIRNEKKEKNVGKKKKKRERRGEEKIIVPRILYREEKGNTFKKENIVSEIKKGEMGGNRTAESGKGTFRRVELLR